MLERIPALRCDQCLATTFRFFGQPDESGVETRAKAKREGWRRLRTTAGRMVDLCPWCAKPTGTPYVREVT